MPTNEEIAKAIIDELDDYGRELDCYGYGLPVFSDSRMQEMINIIIKHLPKTPTK